MGITIVKGALLIEGKDEPDFDKAFKDGMGEGKSVAQGTRVVFPIVRNTDKEFKPLATGFFISNNGLFVTAKHVFEEAGLKGTDLAGVEIIHTGEETRFIIRQVVKFECHPKADLAVGILITVGDHTNKLLSLTKENPVVGNKIKSWSFPMPKEHDVDEKTSAVNFTFQSSDGIITHHFPDGRGDGAVTHNLAQTCTACLPSKKSGKRKKDLTALIDHLQLLASAQRVISKNLT